MTSFLGNNSIFNLGILVSGRGSNLQAIVDAIEVGKLNANVAMVLSNKKNVPALARCKKHGIEHRFVDPKTFSSKADYEQELATCLHEKSVNLVCLAGYMRVLGMDFISSFRGRIVNIHPSLLPAFPGLDAQKKALAHGAKWTGCTVHFVNEDLDSGPIIAQTPVSVHDGDTEKSLSERILQEEHKLYPQAIQWIVEGRIETSGRRVLLRNNR